MFTQTDRRCRPAVGLSLVVLLTGCAYGDGALEGAVRFAMTVTLDPADRAVDGGYETRQGYLVEVEQAELSILDMRVLVADAEVEPFDPANPPEEYVLCHTGHCHTEDGDLVPYEDVEAMMAESVPSTRLVQSTGAAVPLLEEGAAVERTSCTRRCVAPAGRIGSVTVRASGVSLLARITDLREGEESERLPGGSMEVDLAASELLKWTALLRQPVNTDGEANVQLNIDLTVPATAFSAVDWTSPDADLDFLGRVQASSELQARGKTLPSP